MSLPSWILSIGVVFWGIAIDAWPVAVPAVAGLLAPRFVSRRLEVSKAEFSRVLDVCWLLVFGGVLWTYSREPVGSVLRSFIQWLPLVFFPAILVQVWSERERIPMAALLPLPWWRRRDHGPAELEVSGPYLVFCLLSASVTAGGRTWFFFGLGAVAGLALWKTRARGFPVWLAGLFLVLALAGGWLVSLGLSGLQGWFENQFLTWVTQWRRDDGAFRVARTAIGSTGSVGGSGRVVLTVGSEGDDRVPPRLRAAVFSAWSDGAWYAPAGTFEKIEGTGGEWTLEARQGLTGSTRVELRADATGGLLAVPGGVRVIGDCPADSLERTSMGAIRATFSGGMLPYRADFEADAGWEMEPTEDETREVRVAERPAIDAVGAELGLVGLAPAEVLDRVARHFAVQFRYTTELKPSTSKDPLATTALGRFLLSDREGHCEYFATAGVLLLRSVGVPARYVTGFLVNPQDQANGVYTVRAKDAHAWVRAWVDGKWQDFDPTPPAMFEAAPTVSRWDRFWSDLRYAIVRWWWLGEKRWLREAYWLVLPLLALTVWRFRRMRASRASPESWSGERVAMQWPGADSEWFQVEAGLAVKGWSRRIQEAWGPWLGRLAAEVRTPAIGERITRVYSLHARLRFDPVGLTPVERAELRRVAGELVEEIGPGGITRRDGATRS